jgi:hypothetical protein
MSSESSAAFVGAGRNEGSVRRVGSADAYDRGPPASASGKLAPLATMAVLFPATVPTAAAPDAPATRAAVS